MVTLRQQKNKENSLKEKDMVYLTKDYVMKEFESREKALEHIKKDLDDHNLS